MLHISLFALYQYSNNIMCAKGMICSINIIDISFCCGCFPTL